jgi:predicted RNA-binding protein YlqC (UPF0109 family)
MKSRTTGGVVPKDKVPQTLAAELVQRIISEITFHHNKLKVEAGQLGMGWQVVVTAHKADVPRIIGGRGMTFKALDCVVAAVGNKYRMKLRTKIVEPAEGEPDRYERFRPAEDWNREGILNLLQDTCKAVFAHPVEDIAVEDIDNQTSLISVKISHAEDRRAAEFIGKALEILWNAIGKANGRTIRLDIGAEGIDSSRDLSQIFE